MPSTDFPHPVRCLIAACLVLALATSPYAFADDEVLTYRIVGLKNSLLHNARAWLGTAPTSGVERLNFLVTAEQRVQDSLQALGYYDADIRLEVNRSEPVWSVKISVDPGEPVLIRNTSIELLGAAMEDPEFGKLLAKSPFKQGDVFNHGEYEQFKDELLALGQQRGYFDARFAESRVEVNVDARTADIFLHYDSGERFRFGPLLSTETKLDHRMIAELQTFSEGDYFEQAKLQMFQARLQRTRYFSGVLLRPVFDQAEDYRVPVALTLHPARRHVFDVGLGYSTDTQERVSFNWRTPLLNRYGHSQETRIAYSSVNPGGQFIYSIPLSHPLDDVLHLSARLEDNKYGDIDSQQREAGVRREVRRTNWIYSWSGRGLEESWELKNFKFENSYLLPGFAISRSDRVGSIVDPSGGFSQLYQVEGASSDLGSDIDLLRVTANFSYILSPAVAHRIVSRAALGAVFIDDSDRDQLAPSLNFFAGGSQSIRGYGYQSIGNELDVTREDGTRQTLVVGGDRLVTASLEYQYYFTDAWRGALFVDAGDAFDEGEFDLNVGPGFGIHYLSPVGAVRLEFANSVTDKDPSWRLHLNIGAEF
jgi:translocation and assembly module TamA